MWRRVWIMLALLALLAAASCTVPIAWDVFVSQDDRTLAVLHDQYGAVTSGQKFGVRVGMDWAEADRVIRRQFKPDYVQWEGPVEDPTYGEGPTVDGPILKGKAEVYYRDRSWRDGVITLELEDGRVTAIKWHYPGPFYIDL